MTPYDNVRERLAVSNKGGKYLVLTSMFRCVFSALLGLGLVFHASMGSRAQQAETEAAAAANEMKNEVQAADETASPKTVRSAEKAQSAEKAESEKTKITRSDIRPLCSKTLARLLKKQGYEPPETFKALVIEIVSDAGGGFVYYPYDYNGTSKHRENWWPASTVKLYAAIAALERVRALGFTPLAEVTLHYPDKPVTRPLYRIVRLAITQSNNVAFDQLVELVGFNYLNGRFLTEKNGLGSTVMLRAYASRITYPQTGNGSNRHSSRITVSEKGRSEVLPERDGKGVYECPEQGNCTTLGELAEAMRRVMMHEHIPRQERYRLGKAELRLLRSALAGKRKREGGVAEGLMAAFQGREIRIYHKGGYAYQWFTDNVFLHIPKTNERWIITMTNHPGRQSLDKAGRHMAELIASGKLSRARLSNDKD